MDVPSVIREAVDQARFVGQDLAKERSPGHHNLGKQAGRLDRELGD
jgi:hypothetical protein